MYPVVSTTLNALVALHRNGTFNDLNLDAGFYKKSHLNQADPGVNHFTFFFFMKNKQGIDIDFANIREIRD